MKRLPLAVGLVGILAALVAQLVSSLGLSGWPARVLLVAGALVTAGSQVWERAIQPRQEEAKRLRDLLALWPVPLVRDVSPYDIGVFRSSIAEDHADGGEPPYAERRVDAELDVAVRQSQFVVVAGPSKAGKSRTAFQALRRALPDASLVVPVSPFEAGASRPLPELAAGPALRELAGRRVVVWLDDVEVHLRSGQLTRRVLRGLREAYPDVVVMATLRYRALDQLETDIVVAGDVRQVLATATRIDLERDLTGDELEAARQVYPGLGGRSALAEYLTATDLLVERYRRGFEVNPGGVAVVRAAVDWERCGAIRPIPRNDLRVLAERRLDDLRANLAFTDRSFDEAVTWACEPVVSTAALLSVLDGAYDAFDYVVDWVSENEGPVDDATWAWVVDELAETEGLGIGLAAYNAGRHDHAAEAWRAAANREPAAAAKLGLLHEEQGDLAGSAAAYQLAVDSGDPDVAPWAALALGLRRQAEGDATGAAANYQLAAESGHPDAAPGAAYLLGALREEQGDTIGAAAAYQVAIDSGHADLAPRAADNLRALRYQLAIDSGHPDEAPKAAFKLGVLREEQGLAAAAAAAYQLAIDSGHAEIAPLAADNLRALRQEGQQQGDPS